MNQIGQLAVWHLGVGTRRELTVTVQGSEVMRSAPAAKPSPLIVKVASFPATLAATRLEVEQNRLHGEKRKSRSPGDQEEQRGNNPSTGRQARLFPFAFCHLPSAFGFLLGFRRVV